MKDGGRTRRTSVPHDGSGGGKGGSVAGVFAVALMAVAAAAGGDCHD